MFQALLKLGRRVFQALPTSLPYLNSMLDQLIEMMYRGFWLLDRIFSRARGWVPYRAEKNFRRIFHPPVTAHPFLQFLKSLINAAFVGLRPNFKTSIDLQFWIRGMRRLFLVGFVWGLLTRNLILTIVSRGVPSRCHLIWILFWGCPYSVQKNFRQIFNPPQIAHPNFDFLKSLINT